MQAHDSWSYKPYRPLLFDGGDIYICRVAPGADTIILEWLPLHPGAQYAVFCAPAGETPMEIGQTSACSYHITGLMPRCDYQIMVACGDKRSRIRLARTSEPIGTVVNYLHPQDRCYAFSGQYLCSPSIVRHPQGHLLASMDLYGCHTPQNLTLIFRSDDDGKTWRHLTELFPCFWGKLFIHKEALYILACSTEYGDLLIGRSDDGGATFGTPTVLLRGSGKSDMPGVHKNPQPLVVYNHRLWATLEWGTWAQRSHAAMVISADTNADLLDAKSWHITPPLPYNSGWEGIAKGESTGTIEGTLVTATDGLLYNVMRYDMRNCTPNFGLVLAYAVNTGDADAPLRYSHAIRLPGNHSKFSIQYDSQSGCYWTIIDRIMDERCLSCRNLLSLMYSEDLEHWSLALDLIDRSNEDPALTGFQYVDFIIEGNDLLYLCRTAMNGAHSYHDSNYITFHRLENFRIYQKAGKV